MTFRLDQENLLFLLFFGQFLQLLSILSLIIAIKIMGHNFLGGERCLISIYASKLLVTAKVWKKKDNQRWQGQLETIT